MTAACQIEQPIVSARISNTPEAVRGQLRKIETLTEVPWIGAEYRGDVLLVMAEVFNNIVEHAFEMHAEGWIDCTIRREGDSLLVETRDNGAPLPASLLQADPTLPQDLPDAETLPEGGYGWFIVHSLTDDMTYVRANGTNTLTFSIKGGREDA